MEDLGKLPQIFQSGERNKLQEAFASHSRKKTAVAESFRHGVIILVCLRLFAALGATGGVRAAFGARRFVFAATTVAGHGRLGAFRFATGLAAGGHHQSCGKNRSQDHH